MWVRYVLLMNDDQPVAAPDAASETVPLVGRPNLARWLVPVAMGTIGIVLGVAGTLVAQAILSGSASGAPEQNLRLSEAYSSCGSPAGATIADENRTLTIDVKGKDDSYGASYEDQACILRGLDAPSSLISHLEQTTSIDGRQTESWDGITAAWSYHPDRGSDMVITLDVPDQ